MISNVNLCFFIISGVWLNFTRQRFTFLSQAENALSAHCPFVKINIFIFVCFSLRHRVGFHLIKEKAPFEELTFYHQYYRHSLKPFMLIHTCKSPAWRLVTCIHMSEKSGLTRRNVLRVYSVCLIAAWDYRNLVLLFRWQKSGSSRSLAVSFLLKLKLQHPVLLKSGRKCGQKHVFPRWYTQITNKGSACMNSHSSGMCFIGWNAYRVHAT